MTCIQVSEKNRKKVNTEYTWIHKRNMDERLIWAVSDLPELYTQFEVVQRPRTQNYAVVHISTIIGMPDV